MKLTVKHLVENHKEVKSVKDCFVYTLDFKTFPLSSNNFHTQTLKSVLYICKILEQEGACKQCRPRSDCSLGAVCYGSALVAPK